MNSTTPAPPIAIVGRRTDFVPEAFRMLQGDGIAPPPKTACASCPASQWFHQDYWQCFCTVMKSMTWQSKSSPIRACSARESAIVNFEQRRQAAAGQ